MNDMTAPQFVDILITAGCVVTVDSDRRILRDGAIAINKTNIVAIGPRAEIDGAYVGMRRIDAPNGLVMPGLIDAHVHPIDYLIKGIVDDTPQIIRLRDRVIPYEDALTDEEAYASSLASFIEMIRAGTTCFVDGAGPQPHAVGRAAVEMGLRGTVAHRVQDLAGPFGGHVDDAATNIAKADEVYDRWNGAANGRIRACYDIDIPPAASDGLIELVRDHAKARDARIVGHFIGRPPMPGQPAFEHNPEMERLDRLGVLGPHLTLAHIGWIPRADVELLASSGTNIAHCPAASLVGGNGWVTHGVMPDLVAAGARVVLGSDAAAIARTMDMVRMMSLAAGVNKDARRDPTIMNPYKVFEMATIQSAIAIGLEDRIGSLEIGKAADIAIFDTSGPHWWPEPFANPVPDFVYGGSGRDAKFVIIDGRIILDDGELVGVDLNAIGALVRAARDKGFKRHGFVLTGQWPNTETLAAR